MAIYKPIPSFDEASLRLFWSRVGGNGLTHLCWPWSGATKNGYGTFRGFRAHRIAYTLKRGAIPDGLTLDHTCRNILCCNPNHLDPVESRVNILRGEGVMARHARKTHCPRGHEYTPENTIVMRKGNGTGRHCRACKNDHYRRSWAAGKRKRGPNG